MKKLILILLPLLLLGGGGTFFAASKGMINIPGISPKKLTKKTPPKVDTKAPLKKAPPKKKEPTPSLDEDQGRAQLASIWADLEADQLAKITGNWTPKDLAPILMKMEKSKVTAFLGELEAKRASDISREIQRIASVVVG